MTYFLNFLWIEKSYWKHTERGKNYCKVCFKWQKPYFSHVNFCCFGICFVCFQERGGNCCWKHNWTFLFFMLSIKLSNFFLLGNERKTRTVFFCSGHKAFAAFVFAICNKVTNWTFDWKSLLIRKFLLQCLSSAIYLKNCNPFRMTHVPQIPSTWSHNFPLFLSA